MATFEEAFLGTVGKTPEGVSSEIDTAIESSALIGMQLDGGSSLDVLRSSDGNDISIFNSALSSDSARSVSATFNPFNKVSLATVQQKMQNDEIVKIACYGDSTVAGVATTDYTANTATSGQAAGVADETTSSPNAFPFLMNSMLNEMYGSTNTRVFNCGYSGMSLANGWGLRNYASAVVNNPDIGHPEACIVCFGLNDAKLANFSVTTFAIELEKLVALMIGFGTLPILMSCNPSATGAGGDRDNKLMEAIETSKEEIAKKYSIPFFDFTKVAKTFMTSGRDGEYEYRWARISNDGTHMNDQGHLLKASYLSAMMYSGTIILNNESEYISTWDSRSNTLANFDNSNSSPTKNTRLQKNAYIPSAPTSTDLMTLYVWNPGEVVGCLYNGIGNEGYANAGGTPPVVSIQGMSVTELNKQQQVIGAKIASETLYSGSDVPYEVGTLFQGLNKVTYKSGSVAYDAYFGSFSFIKNFNDALSKNAISGFRAKSASIGVTLPNILPAGVNTVEIPSATNQALRIHLKSLLQQNSGVVLWFTQNFDGDSTSWEMNRKLCVVLSRNTDDSFTLKLVRANADGSVESEVSLFTSTAATITNDIVDLLIVINTSSTGQRWRIYENERLTGAALIDQTILFAETPAPWGGIVGGAYVGVSSLKEVHLRSVDVWAQ